MIIRSSDYPKSADIAKHGGAGQFGVETILTRDQMGKAGRLFVRGTLKPGHSVGMHAHNGDMEICYVLAGKGVIREDDGSEYEVYPGDANITMPGHAHEILNMDAQEDFVYLAIVLYP